MIAINIFIQIGDQDAFVSLGANVADNVMFDRQNIRVPLDNFQTRLQEHVNNLLNQVCNAMQQQLKRRTK